MWLYSSILGAVAAEEPIRPFLLIPLGLKIADRLIGPAFGNLGPLSMVTFAEALAFRLADYILFEDCSIAGGAGLSAGLLELTLLDP